MTEPRRAGLIENRGSNFKGDTESLRAAQRQSQAARFAALRANQNPLLRLQRTMGNRAVQRLLASLVQPKLTVGAPDDIYEKEADKVADEVMSSERSSLVQQQTGSAGSDDDRYENRLRELAPAPASPEVHRKCACGGDAEGECAECRMNRLAVQRLSSSEDAGLEAPAIVEHVLASPGQPLADSARRTLEPGFGHDFSQVRVHDDSQAAESASAVSALAYTVGNHIVFGSGQYAPGTTDGNRLLAHELTHTIQQTGGTSIRTHLARLGQTESMLIQRDPDNLDDVYNSAVQSGDWQAAAEKLNGFSKEDIQSRLSRLSSDQVASIHQGALDNPRVGPDSQVAQLTSATATNQESSSQLNQPHVPENGTDGYTEETEDFTADDSGEPDVDLPAQNVGDGNGQDASVPTGEMVAAPAPAFVNLGRVGTARYGDPLTPDDHLIAHAFTDGGRTATNPWAGGDGAGAHGNQNIGSLQSNIAPIFFQTSPKADTWIREGTGKIDVIRSWTGVNDGDQGNGFFLTAAAAARINLHETLHVANSQGHYSADIDPLLTRVLDKTMEVGVAKALLPPTSPRSIPALKAIIQWPASVTRFQTGDEADNKRMGTVDTADLASGTYVVNVGPRMVAGKAFNHVIRTPGEANPLP